MKTAGFAITQSLLTEMLQLFPHRYIQVYSQYIKKALGYNKIVAVLKTLRLKNAECGSIISDAVTPTERNTLFPFMGNPVSVKNH